jgi:hypothetical protein
MKNFLLLLFFSFFFCHAHFLFAQSGEWTWVHGDSVVNSAGYYGSIGVPDPLNNPPAVYEPIHWIDRQDNLWIYGGFNSTGALYQAMWKYNPYTNVWTWMQGSSTPNQSPVYGTQGIPSPSNSPGSRNCSLAWTDSTGNLWLMGGYTLSNATLGDLWKFDVATLEWTWMNGSIVTGVNNTLAFGIPSSVNYPRAIAETNCAWTDNQNRLWFYGGIQSYYLTYFDWVVNYNISSNEWTWVRGISNNSQPVYGTMGVPASTNNPGSRIAYARWQDASGDFWFMNGSTVNGNAKDHNDVWRYDPVADEWTWMLGLQAVNDTGNYSAFCNSVTGDVPAARSEDKAVYRDRNHNIWMFGGTTAAANNDFNDLWIFNSDSLKYKWMHGSRLWNQPGVYGQLNVASPLNIPHSRDGAILFGDSLCHIYLFAGIYRHPSSTFNDVWMFTPDTSCVACNLNRPLALFSSPTHICPGTCVNFTNLSSNATSFTWLFPGAVPSVSVDFSPAGICYNTPGTYDVTLIASGAGGTDTLVLVNSVTVYPNPPGQGISQSGDTLFANPGAVTYQWYHNGSLIPGATNYFYVASTGGNFNVVATDSNDCEVEAAIFDVAATIESTNGDLALSIFPNPVEEKLKIHNAQCIIGTALEISIYNALGEKVLAQYILSNRKGSDISLDVSGLPSGLYLLKMVTGQSTFSNKFVKE